MKCPWIGLIRRHILVALSNPRPHIQPELILCGRANKCGAVISCKLQFLATARALIVFSHRAIPRGENMYVWIQWIFCHYKMIDWFGDNEGRYYTKDIYYSTATPSITTTISRPTRSEPVRPSIVKIPHSAVSSPIFTICGIKPECETNHQWTALENEKTVIKFWRGSSSVLLTMLVMYFHFDGHTLPNGISFRESPHAHPIPSPANRLL